MRHFCSLTDISVDECRHLIDDAIRLKSDRPNKDHQSLLAGRVLGLLFEKPSMRTRVSFEAAVAQCGGGSIFLSGKQVGIGQREAVQDFARVISQYVDILAARTFSHDLVLDLARHATCPVINALSDREHPCQALADVCTMREMIGPLEGQRLVFVGDGNNVARSLAHAAALTGIQFVLSAPAGYEFRDETLQECRAICPKASIEMIADPRKAVAGADVVYTDVWASMGQESESHQRQRDFLHYQVNARLMAHAKPNARFMHCLPAHRGDEVTDEVMDSPNSVIVEQAGYRLHAQKALLIWLLAHC